MPEQYPLDEEWSEDDDERWLAEQERLSLPTPAEDFDAFFEQWQDATEDRHVRQTLAALEAQGRCLMAQEVASSEADAVNAGPRL